MPTPENHLPTAHYLFRLWLSCSGAIGFRGADGALRKASLSRGCRGRGSLHRSCAFSMGNIQHCNLGNIDNFSTLRDVYLEWSICEILSVNYTFRTAEKFHHHEYSKNILHIRSKPQHHRIAALLRMPPAFQRQDSTWASQRHTYATPYHRTVLLCACGLQAMPPSCAHSIACANRPLPIGCMLRRLPCGPRRFCWRRFGEQDTT